MLPNTLIFTLLILILASWFVKQRMQLSDNIWRLFMAQPLAMSATPAVVIAAGILAIDIAPTAELATLPLTLLIIGTAIAVIPASWLLKTIGRRKGSIAGLGLGACGALIASYSATSQNFYALLAGCFLIGNSAAFVAQLRFAALESLDHPEQAPKALSTLMVGGLFSAMIGPEVAVFGRDLIDSPSGFAGSFLILSGCYIVAMAIIATLNSMDVKQVKETETQRSLLEIAKNPTFIIAICSGTIAYSVMSYLMTASPLSMHSDHDYAMETIKWVVQSHVLAMYVPSLFSAYLVKWLGIRKLMLVGTGMYIAVVIISLVGGSVMHYWGAMVLLGIGWNFLFLSGTLLLPESYQPHERFKVQAVNDFSIFAIQAVASLSAGLILFSRGWSNLVMITIPVIILMLFVTLWYSILFRQQQKSNKAA
ncbi:MAG: MFS transporter [Gammaproteobacteria bacterium]